MLISLTASDLPDSIAIYVVAIFRPIHLLPLADVFDGILFVSKKIADNFCGAGFFRLIHSEKYMLSRLIRSDTSLYATYTRARCRIIHMVDNALHRLL